MCPARRKKLLSVVFLLLGCLCDSSCSRPTAPAAQGSESTGKHLGNFDYYLLALSWAPEFCSTHGDRPSSSECDAERHYGFVVHGLWPQNDDGSYPQYCAPTRPVAQDTLQRLLAIMPDRGLIQHEWAEHGTCSGLDVQTYFEEVQRAFNQLQIPPEYRAPSRPRSVDPAGLEQEFGDANHAPASAFRASCRGGDLIGVQVCLTQDLKYRACGSGVRQCRDRNVTMRPLL